jgi:hypothetical protein
MHHTTHNPEGQRKTPKASTMSTVSVPEHLQNESSADARSTDKKRHSVPDWLRNESGVENKSIRKKRRKDVTSDSMTKMLEESRKMFQESRKNRHDLTSQILVRLDTIASNIATRDMKMKKGEESQKSLQDELTSQTVAFNIASDNIMKKLEQLRKNRQELTSPILATNVPSTPEVNESDVLFAELFRIIDAEKQIAANASMSASMRNIVLEVLEFWKEELDAKFVALLEKRKRKALPWNRAASG